MIVNKGILYKLNNRYFIEYSDGHFEEIIEGLDTWDKTKSIIKALQPEE